jgi:transposase-like protein
MKTPRYTLDTLNKEFPDDDACLDYIFQKRYGHLEFCPRCAAETKFYKLKTRKIYKCKFCGFELYPLANTIFHKSETPLTKWFFAIYLFGNGKNGTSAKELERHLGVTYKCAWRMAKQIRLMLQENGDMLSGEIEMDETYAPSRKHPRALGSSKKQVIFGAVERNGRVKASHVKSAGVRVLMPIIEDSVQAESTIYSDEAGVYKSLKKRGYTHTTVNHSKLEYVRGSAHTNTIEGFWGQMKRSIDGTYHSVSPKYLQLYVNEFVYRYNHRHVAAFPAMMEVAAKPIR